MPDPIPQDHGGIFAPYLPNERYLWPAWFGLLHFCLGHPEIVAEFRQQTGNTWEPGRTPISRLVDAATGIEQDFLTQFAAWMNERVWGEV